VLQPRRVDVAEQRAAADLGDPRFRIDFDLVQLRQVDDDAAVAGGEAGEAVAAAAHRHQRLALGGDLHRLLHVALAGGAHDRRRALVDQVVVDPAMAVIKRVFGIDERAVQPGGRKVAHQGVAVHPVPR